MRKYVFIVGCPRSGTTWLQLLLSQHPAISSSMETYLFGYLSAVVKSWDFHKHNKRGIGLQAVLSEEEFDALLRTFAISVLEKMGSGSILLEKTPDHVRSADLILRIIPEAWFIHLIRDPRAVTSSLISAGRSWGSHWASTSAANNARRWVAAVSAGRKIRHMTKRYLEVRYEDILSNGTTDLDRIFGWLELETEPGFCERAIEACAIDRLQAKAAKAPWRLEVDPEGFYRRGIADSWRDDLSKSDICITECIAKELMRELGYKPSTSGEKPLSLILGDVESAVLARCAAMGRRWRGRIENRGGSLSSG